MRAYYLNVSGLAAPAPDPSWPQRVGATVALVGRGLPHVVG